MGKVDEIDEINQGHSIAHKKLDLKIASQPSKEKQNTNNRF
jgi:hypothetical protein